MTSFDGCRIGDVTLCQICGDAIQLRRVDIRGLGPTELWVHFREIGISHPAQPKRFFVDTTNWVHKVGRSW
jgi:hypothetical protein